MKRYSRRGAGAQIWKVRGIDRVRRHGSAETDRSAPRRLHGNLPSAQSGSENRRSGGSARAGKKSLTTHGICDILWVTKVPDRAYRAAAFRSRLREKPRTAKPNTQGYRSGHNEAVLKTVWRQRHVGSNPTPCAKKSSFVRMRIFYLLPFHFSLAVSI